MRLTVIGTGNMGTALLAGMLSGGLLFPGDVTLFDIDRDKAAQTASLYGCTAAGDAADAVRDATHVLIAVKPQYFDTALRPLTEHLRDSTILLSVAAGIRMTRIRALAGPDRGIVRIFPNTPALVGKGVLAMCADGVTDPEGDEIAGLLGTCGLVVPCDEPTLDRIGAVSGTGPAWLMLVAEALADGAVRAGLPRDLAIRVAGATIEGAGALLVQTGSHPGVLKDQVCSPGGTTIEGVRRLEQAGVRSAFIEAVAAAMAKSDLLAGND